MRNFTIAACVLGLAGVAHAGQQADVQLGPNAFVGAGGPSGNDAVQHFAAFGSGVATGQNGNDGVTAIHGVLGRRSQGGEDQVPPRIVPIDDLVVEAGAGCVADVELPAIEASDNRDRSPDITVTLQTNPPQDIDPGGAVVELAYGSYDVLISVIDGSGNRTRASYVVDVVDRTAPVLQVSEEDDSVPDPTPAGEEAEARSPAGTPQAINYVCLDHCDDDPEKSRQPVVVRYPVGDSVVAISCTDRDDNVSTEDVTIRVRDTTPPRVAGNVPDNINEECNDRAGAVIEVPQLVWGDNASSAEDLTVSLILNPGEAGEREFAGEDYPPDELLLIEGEHTLRYVAVDEAGNSAMADLTVTVVDNGVPEIVVRDAPDGGWHNGEGAVSVGLDIFDGCGDRQAGDLDLEFRPNPENVVIDGNSVTLTYSQPGVYNLSITATDEAGNDASDNSVGFGIDRDAPSEVVRVPSQAGVNPEDESTLPLWALAEVLQVNVGGVEDGDGVVAGIQRAQVVLDPDGANRLIADVEYEGNGNPPRGERVASNVGCELAQNGQGEVDGWCTEDGELNLRKLGTDGPHELRVTVTDFAGNSSSTTAYFMAVNLVGGLPFIQEDLNALIAAGPPVAVRGRLIGALQQLGLAAGVADLEIEDNPYGTPIFLGGALRYVQNATIALNQAAAAAEGELQDDVKAVLHLLLRLAKSDVQLLQQSAIDNGEPDIGYLVRAYEVDNDFVDEANVVVRDNLSGEEWNSGAANSLIGVFHAKSMYSSWILDWASQPDPFNRPEIAARYEGALAILTEIRDELNAYLTLDNPPAEANMQQLRDRLSAVLDDLNALIADNNGDGNADLFIGDPIDPEAGMTDEEYTAALIALRAAANFSSAAANQGAWVRNYQWSIMQVVRYFVQTSVESVIAVHGAGRDNWPIYVRARELIEGGVQELDDREVQAVIDRYGQEEDSICLIIAIYHCDFTTDEGENDEDNIYSEDNTPAFCWDKMYRPSEWDEIGADPRFPRQGPECHYAPNGDLREEAG